MATTLALAMKASMSAAGVVSGADQAAKALDKFGNAAVRASRDASVIKNIELGKLLGGGIAAVGNTLANLGSSMGSYAIGVANAADATNDLAQRTGIGVEALQSLQVAAKLGGVDDATAAFQKMGIAIGKAIENGDASDFEKIGVNFQELAVMAPEDQFRAIAAAISAVPGEASRAAAAVAIFGKSGAELLPFLANLDGVEERARRLGVVLSEKQIGNIGGMNDALDLARQSFDGITGQVVANLAPAVTSMVEEFLAFVEAFGGEGGSGLANAVTAALFDGAQMLAEVFDRFSAQFADWLGSFESFGSALTTTAETFSVIGNVITAVAETLRGVFNVFEAVGNTLIGSLGMAVEHLGWAFGNDKAEAFGKELADSAAAQLRKNVDQAGEAFGNAGGAAVAAFSDAEAGAAGGPGAAARGVAAARAKFGETADPAAKAKRDAEAKLERQQALLKKKMDDALVKVKADQAQREKAAEAAKKKALEDEAKMQERVNSAGEFRGANAAMLDKKSSAALQANDIRTSEGISQYLALATGREDPAVEEYRKQHATLMQLLAEQRAQRTANAEILGAGAA
jgi:muconolactone delta-isomerase